MKVLSIDKANDGKGWVVEVEKRHWFRKQTVKYYTIHGIYYWDENGKSPGHSTETWLYDVFIKYVDSVSYKFWSEDHPSPEMKAAKHFADSKVLAIKALTKKP